MKFLVDTLWIILTKFGYRAIFDSEKEYKDNLSKQIERLQEDPDVLDEIVKPSDAISESILDCIAEEKVCEDKMEIIKAQFRKKKLETDEYLDAIRTLSGQQFWAMAKRRKVMSMVSAHNR